MTKHLTQKWKELVEDTLEHTIEQETRPDYHDSNMYRLKQSVLRNTRYVIGFFPECFQLTVSVIFANLFR